MFWDIIITNKKFSSFCFEIIFLAKTVKTGNSGINYDVFKIVKTLELIVNHILNLWKKFCGKLCYSFSIGTINTMELKIR